MKITWLGTASVLAEICGERILFDPFVQLVGGENPNCIEDFWGNESICITHGHLDHMLEVSEFLEEDSPCEATVYCGSVAAKTLGRIAEETGRVVQVGPGTVFRIGDVKIRVWEGKHARPGIGQAAKRLFSLRTVHYLRNAVSLAWLHRFFPEGGQTYLYELRAEGKTVLVMGSLGLMDGVCYPEGADLLILPYQGSKNLEKEALRVVERLRPKRILLDHFDDAFPPISQTVDTHRFKKRMDEKFPGISVVKPLYGKPVEV